MYRCILFRTFLFAGIALGVSCNKDISSDVPAGGEPARINFKAVSDVLKNYSIGGIGIFMDIEPYNTFTGTSSAIPNFQTENGNNRNEFPLIYGSPGLYYMPAYAGSHRLRMGYMAPDSASRSYGVVFTVGYIDTTLNMPAGSATLTYLIDGPLGKDSAAPVFKLLTIDAERSLRLDSGKVLVKIVHQSPGTEPLQVAYSKADGSFASNGMPQSLSYASVSDKILLDTKEARAGLIALRFTGVSSGKEYLRTAIPANSGHSYILSVTGFGQTRNFSVPRSVGADKKLVYGNARVTADLRAEIRQIW